MGVVNAELTEWGIQIGALLSCLQTGIDALHAVDVTPVHLQPCFLAGPFGKVSKMQLNVTAGLQFDSEHREHTELCNEETANLRCVWLCSLKVDRERWLYHQKATQAKASTDPP